MDRSPYRPHRSLDGRVIVVTGASRGIGRAIALRAAADGARVALLARTEAPNPKIDGTLTDTAQAVRNAGGRPLAISCDVRDPDAVAAAVEEIAGAFGRIDVVVNNAGALDLRNTAALPPKAFQRLLAVNVEGPYALVHSALPHLRKAENPHVVNISPPLNFNPAWLGTHVAHTVGKYAESMLTIGWADEFASIPIAVNSVWPATMVASTGLMVAMGEETVRGQARTPEIMADAVHALVTRPAADGTGRIYTDAEILRAEGVEDLAGYRLAATDDDLVPNFYLTDQPTHSG
ncbi:SDR family oxidoreductase [Mycobacterium sp. CVI_P3]|uniref:SDR family oxidoreductase n=1 Tax=Mycobacterium pinniadriaticum TaxID=2994102 RepID=A0ABT3SF04_9MYCO|nr:SDR family oxidoreductase [Mycobacterium pinniadriaticum]MCX2931646.1 SDR family oxidoreductase [Mycobacterium pinniadriaticum]MCX2937962.1 SDR family oxidoreductase [Mycobacterium pinniadriaticum]